MQRTCKTCGDSHQIEAFYQHSSSKGGRISHCPKCVYKRKLELHRDDIESFRVNSREYNRKYQSIPENKARIAEYRKKWLEGRKGDPVFLAGRAADCSKRRAALRKRLPVYVDEVKIGIKYRTARIMSKITGVEYDVDHIVPLQGRLVSGLHHEDNLRVIKATENRSKFNKYTPQFISWRLYL